MNKKKFLLNAVLFILPLLTVFLAFSLMQPTAKKSAPHRGEKTWRVAVMPLSKGIYSPNQILFGQVESTQRAQLNASIASNVIKVHVKEGQKVNKAQALIQLDDREFVLLVKEKKAELAALKAQQLAELVNQKINKTSLGHDEELVKLNQQIMKRFEYLKKRRLGSASQVDDANKVLLQQLLALQQRQQSIENHQNKLLEITAKINKAEAQLARARLDLDECIIRAPFEGKITQVDVSVGDQVILNTPLVSLYDLNEVAVRAQIPHRLLTLFINALKNKESISAYPNNYPEIKLPFERLSSEVGSGDASIDAFFSVSKQVATLVPLGTTVKLTISLPKITAFKIPSKALYGHDKIFLVRNNRLSALKIKRLGQLIEKRQLALLIESPDILPQDTILITKLPNARSGLKVLNHVSQ